MKRLAAALLFVSILALSLTVLTPSAPSYSAQTATLTPDPYAGLGIDDLAARFYGRGEITLQRSLLIAPTFERWLFSYPSDDLTIYGFADLPYGPGPFPVIIALHGYIDPAIYDTLDYTTHYADTLAQAGYLVLHPNLRGYAPSDSGPNAFRVGMAIDVLNLIGIVRQTGGLPGTLHSANPLAVGLWGHSMGGGITLRVLTVSPDVRAAVLYGAMSGDERQNYTKIAEWSGGSRGAEELLAPDDALQRISAIYYLDRISAAVSIHHGASDLTVPPAWSSDLCARLMTLGKTVECFSYDGQPHTFYGEGDLLFKQRVTAFFDAHLK